jgi:twitching motility protein PilT
LDFTTKRLDPFVQHLMETNASDLHMAAGSMPRLRVDGRLLDVPGASICTDEQIAEITRGLVSEADLAVLERDLQLDFAFTWTDPFNPSVTGRFRGNAFQQKDRPALALRLIPTQIPTPQELNLPPATAGLAKRPHGLILMTGPTGSGKSTTQAAMIGWINRNRPLHILTIEDPVEYVHESELALVNQREIGRDATSFPEAMRSALREDPDVVLVGEMRDLETVRLALTLAETGHLVFGTVHTNDAAQTVDRIVDTFPEGQHNQIRTQFSMTLAAVVSQRLVRKIGGGRVAAFEVLMGTPGISNLIREGQVRQIRNAIATGRDDGMQTLETSLNQLIASGVVSYESALEVSVYPDELERPVPRAVFGPDGQPVIHPSGIPIYELPGIGYVDQFGQALPDLPPPPPPAPEEGAVPQVPLDKPQ